MGVVSVLFGDGSEEVHKAFEAFGEEERWSEADLASELETHLSARLRGIQLMRGVRIPGTEERVDLLAHYRDHDYLITVRKSLSDPIVEKEIGRIRVIMDRWRPKVPEKRAYIYLCSSDVKAAKGSSFMRTFRAFVARANRGHDFEVRFAAPNRR